jgi:hypothetical protein
MQPWLIALAFATAGLGALAALLAVHPRARRRTRRNHTPR